MTDWQPIETAPDHQEVLLFYPRHAAGRRIGYRFNGEWRVGMDMNGRQPTKWMPLPDPPEGEEFWPALPFPKGPQDGSSRP